MDFISCSKWICMHHRARAWRTHTLQTTVSGHLTARHHHRCAIACVRIEWHHHTRTNTQTHTHAIDSNELVNCLLFIHRWKGVSVSLNVYLLIAISSQHRLRPATAATKNMEDPINAVLGIHETNEQTEKRMGKKNSYASAFTRWWVAVGPVEWFRSKKKTEKTCSQFTVRRSFRWTGNYYYYKFKHLIRIFLIKNNN